MNKKKIRLLISCVFILFINETYAQDFIDLRKNFKYKSSHLKDMTNDYPYYPVNQYGQLDYVTPMKNAFFNAIPLNKTKSDVISRLQLLSIIGDERGIEQIQDADSKIKMSKKDESKDTFFQYLQSIQAFLSGIETNKVIMINESHIKVQARAFIISLLSTLKAKGYTHLAMETLNYDILNEVSLNTGYYTMEPVMGEIVRTALRLGFILVPYEDRDAIKHTPQERETIQATNLWNSIKSSPSNSKFMVIAGYSHIAEKSLTKDIEYDIQTMAMEFKRVSDIDPFTINQVISFNETHISNALFQNIINSFKNSKISKALLTNADDDIWHFDSFILHPSNRFKNGRPTWLNCNGKRKNVRIKIHEQNVVIVQAYYKKEINTENDFTIKIPADQSFYLDRSFRSHLYLVPGNEYIVVFRDQDNKILLTQRIKV